MNSNASQPANSDHNESKLLQLIESTIIQRRIEMNELEKRLEELINDDALRMMVDSFTVKPGMGGYKYKISITSENSTDLKIWRQFFITALAKLELHGNVKIGLGKASVSIDISYVKKLLQFLKPIVSKMEFVNKQFMNLPGEVVQPCCDFFEANPNKVHLNRRMKFVLENLRDEFQNLLDISESIKKNENQNQLLRSLSVNGDDKCNERIVLTASGDDSTQVSLWLPCLRQAVFDVADSCFEIDGKSERASVAINTDDIGKVLQRIQPLVKITVFDEMDCRCLKTEFVRLFTNFMDGASVPFMIISLKNLRQANDVNEASFVELAQNEESMENNYWIEFMTMAKVAHVYCFLHKVNPNVYSFLLDMAGILEMLSISEYEVEIGSPAIPISVLREILRRKCKWLQLCGDKTILSLSDVQDLIQLFHHLEKKVCLEIPVKESVNYNQIGKYMINSFSSKLEIRHTGFGSYEEL